MLSNITAQVDRIGLAGTNGEKFPAIREHLKKNISDVYAGLDVSCDTYVGHLI